MKGRLCTKIEKIAANICYKIYEHSRLKFSWCVWTKQGNTSLVISLIVNKEVTCSVLEIKKRKIVMLKVWDTETKTTEVD